MSSRDRCSAGVAESWRTARSCDERDHCESRAGRIFSTFSGESWPTNPMASTASVAGAVCNVSRSRCVASSPRLRSEEHTSELQSHSDLVCRLLLEKKKKKQHHTGHYSTSTKP